MEENGALSQSPSMLVPHCKSKPGYSPDRQLAVVDPTTTATAIATVGSNFRLPHDWVVQEVPRPSAPNHIDKYYYEPETGLKFRSLRAVERYLTGEVYTPKPKALKFGNHVHGSASWIISGGKMLRLDEVECGQLQLAVVGPTPAAATSHFTLPDGWIVEGVPRSNSSHIDKYYYEPVTGQKFRSLLSVQKYLEEVKGNAILSDTFQLGDIFKKNNSREGVETSKSNSGDLPLKVKWVLGGPGGDIWNPVIGDSAVPDCVKQQWAERFISSINEGNYKTPNSE